MNVDAEHPCFCGNGRPGTDRQCSWYVNEHGHTVYCCCKSAQGHAAEKGIDGDTAVGIDGCRYVCTGRSKSGYMRFWIRETDREDERREWIETQMAQHPERFAKGGRNGAEAAYAARRRMTVRNAEEELSGMMTVRYGAAAGIAGELGTLMRRGEAGSARASELYARLCRTVFEKPAEKPGADDMLRIMELVRTNRAGSAACYTVALIDSMPDDPGMEEYYRAYVKMSVLAGREISDERDFTTEDFEFVRNVIFRSEGLRIRDRVAWKSPGMTEAAVPAEEAAQYVAPAEHRDRVYRAFLSGLQYEPRHRMNRIAEGWTPEEIERACLRTMPMPRYITERYGRRNRNADPDPKDVCRRLLAEFGKDGLRGVPGFYTDRDGAWTYRTMSGECMPMYDADGHIIQIRVRLDFFDIDRPMRMNREFTRGLTELDGRRYMVDMKGIWDVSGERPVKTDTSLFGKAGKNRSFTSCVQDESGANRLKDGTRAPDEASVYSEDGDDATFFWITEGERKAKMCQMKNRQRCISIPGVGKYLLPERRGYLDRLRELGAEGAIVAFDADRASNANVRQFEEKLILHLKERGFLVQVAVWDPSEGKGIDDLYLGGGSPELVFADDYLENGLEFYLERRRNDEAGG